MEGIELQIILDDSEKSYFVGEKIKGKVTVVVSEECRCEALELYIGVQGLADMNEGVNRYKGTFRNDLGRQMLFQGQWPPDMFTYPFEIEVPLGPGSYKGQIIELGWYLRATACLSCGKGVEAESTLTVFPEKERPGENLDGKPTEVVYRETPKRSLGCLGISLALFLVGTLGAFKTFSSASETLLGITIFFAVLGLILLIVSLYTFLVSKRIGMAEVRIDSGIVSPGDRVPCSLTFQVNKPVEIKEIHVTLVCREEAGNVGIHASKKTYRKVISEEKNALQLPDTMVPANVPIEVRGEFSLPPNASPSFTLADNFGNGIALRWDVKFRMAMERWPDWFYNEKITVLPQI